ncbi:MAG: RagB/SusD family nutrient uptake outer membrane protein [Chitinophaga sp.]|uniref:RagB/SusD family nutrient uptake outer membrane protein n=1 Tax=Chitinophaga sp. TaxID=1869181 RepID=UPI001B17F8B0|nr:RagB/SusD family nutrient uptake outer membrane protein [Chitinophaga sp.]MBO9728585.1 RagB/SusD family nutrient uptake outer membrane protein [Chitinophaga sp.]
MKNNIIKLLVVLFFLVPSFSCHYLEADEYLHEVNNLNNIWTQRIDIRKAWAACYGAMPVYSDMINSWPFNTNYDEGHAGLDGYANLNFAQGKFNPDNTIYNFWSDYYKAIRTCNLFLENYHKANDKLLVPGEIEGYAADARFLRAFYYSQMLELYGPFPIVSKTIDYSKTEELPTTRNTEEECVNFITTELDSCINLLPPKEKIQNVDLGRPSREAAMAIKARVLLWDASPLVNGNPDYNNFKDAKGKSYFSAAVDPLKWKKAADAAKAVIDQGKFELFTVPANSEKLTVPLGNFPGNNVAWPNGPAGIDPYRSYKGLFSGGKSFWNKEAIWIINQGSQTWALTIMGIPRNYNNSEGAQFAGRVAATQKLVDAYFMNNGNTIDEENRKLYNDIGVAENGDGLYIRGNGPEDASPITTGFNQSNINPKVPNRCLFREARFYATIGFIGRGYLQNNGTMYYADYKANALDGYIQTDRPSVRSGYQIVKWVADDEQKAGGSYDKPYHAIRLAEIYLSYAEALNEYSPGDADILKYLNLVRFRAGLPGYEPASKEITRERIKHERYVELAFEARRYFDSRRWKDAIKTTRDNWGNSLGMGGLVYGCNYLSPDGGFYDRAVIDGYVFRPKNYFLPIPYQEVANYWGTLTQNPGW